MLLEMLKDYILLATGAAIGMLVAGVCGAAARGARLFNNDKARN
jgi:hypothetical protein